jgi:hypothetical protein
MDTERGGNVGKTLCGQVEEATRCTVCSMHNMQCHNVASFAHVSPGAVAGRAPPHRARPRPGITTQVTWGTCSVVSGPLGGQRTSRCISLGSSLAISISVPAPPRSDIAPPAGELVYSYLLHRAPACGMWCAGVWCARHMRHCRERMVSRASPIAITCLLPTHRRLNKNNNEQQKQKPIDHRPQTPDPANPPVTRDCGLCSVLCATADRSPQWQWLSVPCPLCSAGPSLLGACGGEGRGARARDGLPRLASCFTWHVARARGTWPQLA